MPMSASPDRSPYRPLGAQGRRPKSTVVACRKCHARKVKCSGGRPCLNCRRDNSESECTYPNRTRHVKVSQSYIDELLAEIGRLQNNAPSSSNAQVPKATTGNDAYFDSTVAGSPQAANGSDRHRGSIQGNHNISSASQDKTTWPAATLSSRGSVSTHDAARNPLLEDRPWFFSLTPEMPILIGEATDAAFATRFRQALSYTSQSHFPRTQYVHDNVIVSSSQFEFPWPTPARARMLVKVALNTVCRRYYLVRKSNLLRILEQAIQDPAQCDILSACTLFAVFALGEAYSARAALSRDQFPGLLYYNSATQVLRVLSEQPRLSCIEIMAMLSLYATAMNRRHTAYCMIGCAVRFAVLMGLHHNVPQAQLPNRDLAEHRIRVWWTIYILDRSWASMLGQPVSIPHEEIGANLPSSQGLSAGAAEDFDGPEYLTAGLRIARLSAEVTSSIYGRNMQRDSFSYRVHQALTKLEGWVDDLPDHLRMRADETSSKIEIADMMLHLYYNQCLILVTRPILLHVLRTRQAPEAEQPSSVQPNEAMLALSEACIRCARHTYRLLIDSWINGSFPTFDYTFTQYLFSSSVILAISSLLQSCQPNTDGEDFDAAVQILAQLSQNGSCAATEFMTHVAATKALIESSAYVSNEAQVNSMYPSASSPVNAFQETDPMTNGQMVNAGAALAEPWLHDPLGQPNLDLDSLETPFLSNDFQSFFWPNTTSVTWMDT